jgi:hypothetical protein
MSFLSDLGGLFQKITSGGTNPEQHFDEVAKAVPCSSLADGLAAAFRSNETAPFAEMASQLFSNGNPNQQAGLLNSLLSSVGPGVLASLGGGGLASLLRPGQTSITPEEAAKVDPAEVQNLAEHVEKRDPSIIDRVSEIYAQHPTLVKTLGAAAVGIAMRKIAETHKV